MNMVPLHVRRKRCGKASWGAEAAPTAEDAGMVLAQLLGCWMTWQRAKAILQSLVQVAQQQAAEISACADLVVLPASRQDPFIQRVLESYDGSPASAEAIALVLHASHEHVQQLLVQEGLPLHMLTAPETLEKQVPGPDHRTAEALPASAGKPSCQDRQFRWTPAMTVQLTGAFLESSEATTAERIRAIAHAYGWPEARVQYKVYELKLPKQWRQARARETAGQQSAPEEEDRSEECC